jgi:hypothetical protein
MSVAVAVVLLVSGCQYTEEHPKTVLGAGVGAAGGAVVGGLAGGKRGAVIGALVGAAAGAGVGNYLDSQDKTAAETNQAHNYQPDQGVVLQLTNVATNPSTVAPGGDVSLDATYALMAPNAQQQFSVMETRIVTLGGTQIANTSRTVDRTAGTYTSKMPITLPAGASTGSYQVQVTVATSGQSTQVAATFSVQ